MSFHRLKTISKGISCAYDVRKRSVDGSTHVVADSALVGSSDIVGFVLTILLIATMQIECFEKHERH